MTEFVKIFDLQFPFEHKGETHKSFEARRPRVSDVRMFSKSVETDPILAMQRLLSSLIGRPEDVVANVDIQDFRVMREWVEDLFSDGKDA